MKSKKILTIGALSIVSIATLVGCGHRGGATKDPLTLNVRMFAAGYGYDWAYELKNNFQKAFKEEGYKVNIMDPSSDMRATVALNDMALGYDKTGVDLYLIGNVTPDEVGSYGLYGVLAEDIEETVWNQKPISYDGTEEDKFIKDKINKDIVPFLKDDSGKMYGFNYSTSAAGLVVNTVKLAKYGLDLPRTTNEMFDCFDKIYCGYNGQPNSKTSKIYPVTYVPGTNGYVNCALNTWLAQYNLDEYNQFWSMTDSEGKEMLDDGYEVYGLEGVNKMLVNAYRAMDARIASPGSTTQKLDQAQAAIMRADGGAVFMFNGDWMLNEVKLNYPTRLNDIEFINTPVSSDLGIRLFGEGTTLNLSDESADKCLSTIIGLVDEDKTIEQIVAGAVSAGYAITTEQAQAVADARGIVYSRGVEHLAYITKGTPKVDMAAKFLRMMASEDFAETFQETANCDTPYSMNKNQNSQYKFVKQASAISNNTHLRIISNKIFGLRKRLAATCTNILSNVTHVPSAIYGTTTSKYTTDGGKETDSNLVYINAAKTMFDSSYTYAKTNWAKWKEAAGI